MNKVTRLLKQFSELKLIAPLARVEEKYISLKRDCQNLGAIATIFCSPVFIVYLLKHPSEDLAHFLLMLSVMILTIGVTAFGAITVSEIVSLRYLEKHSSKWSFFLNHRKTKLTQFKELLKDKSYQQELYQWIEQAAELCNVTNSVYEEKRYFITLLEENKLAKIVERLTLYQKALEGIEYQYDDTKIKTMNETENVIEQEMSVGELKQHI